MTAKLRNILDQIDAVLVKGDATAKGLWAVLTALRGPDRSATPYMTKRQTTVPIRRAAFPRTAANQGIGLPASFGVPGSRYDYQQEPALMGGEHFAGHSRKAARVFRLGGRHVSKHA